MFLINNFSINKYINNIKLATLGPNGTSSEYVALQLFKKICSKPIDIKLFDTHEKAFDDVKTDKSNIFLVANAYQYINNFYMDNEIMLIATFIHKTPSYGIATRKNYDTDLIKKLKFIRIISHSVPIKKLDFLNDGIFKNKRFDIQLCNSTSDAAKNVMNKKQDFCLTNLKSVEIYNLKFVSKVTKISMVWSIFGKTDMLPMFVLFDNIIKGEMK